MFNYQKSVCLEEAKAELDTWSLHHFWSIPILIELCCDLYSALGELCNACGDVLIIRVCEYHDFTKKETVDIIIDLIRHSNAHVHYSGPCTGGSPFNVGTNQGLGEATRLKILAHWKTYDKMWVGFKRIIARCDEVGATSSLEWADRCAYHRLKYVRKLVADNHMVYHKIPGCCFGLKSIEPKTYGKPL